ncbi:MAG TPA: FHA domain-containing protein [Vicinamibacterales bacterium]|nr:FHA domain-containing protein [Vicinamibacterales bacterium]
MKPINAVSQPAVEAKSSSSDSRSSAKPASESSSSEATPSILDPLKSVDVSSLDKLVEIRKELERIKGYRGKAAQKKSSVTDAVFKRVMEDYSKRSAALEGQSAPLKSAATDEYRKLKNLNDSIAHRREQAQLEKDELEFRNSVGELSDEDLAKNLKTPQSAIDQCGADQKAVDAIKTRFVEAFGSLDELENSMEPPTYSSDVAPTTALRPSPVAEKSTGIRPPSAIPGEPPPGTPTVVIGPKALQDLIDPQHDSGTKTIIAPPDFAMPVMGDQRDQDNDYDDGATMMLAAAAIVIIEPASMSQEFQLNAINGIGRSEENQICLLNPGISRKHAIIKAVPGGYSIKDLGSQNGTFVNGQRVTEKALSDGDTIDVGSVQFVFRMPWAPSAAAASAGRSGASSRSKR